MLRLLQVKHKVTDKLKQQQQNQLTTVLLYTTTAAATAAAVVAVAAAAAAACFNVHTLVCSPQLIKIHISTRPK